MKPIATRPRARLELDRFLPYRLSILANTVSAALARVYARRFQLTIPEWRAIAVLGCFGPQTAVEVSARTAMDKVRVSRAVARLIRAGRVTRRTDAKDRRRGVLALTARGVAVHDRIVPLARRAEAELLAALPANDRAALARLLDALQARAQALAARGDAPLP